MFLDGRDADQVMALARDVGFRGVILYDTFVHLDMRVGRKYFADRRS